MDRIRTRQQRGSSDEGAYVRCAQLTVTSARDVLRQVRVSSLIREVLASTDGDVDRAERLVPAETYSFLQTDSAHWPLSSIFKQEIDDTWIRSGYLQAVKKIVPPLQKRRFLSFCT